LKQPLTAEEAYAAGIEDFKRSITVVKQLVERGTVKRDQLKEAQALVLHDLRTKRMDSGELPTEGEPIQGGANGERIH
jgi:hypothetical protein